MPKLSNIFMQKICFVPMCNNTSTKTPKKYFFSVPEDNIEDWCRAVGYKGTVRHGLKICEDHLNLERDLENYMWWHTMGGQGKLKSEPPKLRKISNIQCTKQSKRSIRHGIHTANKAGVNEQQQAVKVGEYIAPINKAVITFQVESDTEDNDNSVSCHFCDEIISGLQYVCVQCKSVHICDSCQFDAHLTHYLLRVPSNRTQEEINRVLQAIRDPLGSVGCPPTECLPLSVNDKTSLINEENFTDIEFLEDDEISGIVATDDVIIYAAESDNDRDENFSDDEKDDDTDDEHEQSVYVDLTEDEREDNRKRARLKDNDRSQTYLEPENLETQIQKYGVIELSKPRKTSPKEIWLQHRGKPSQLDDEATKSLNDIVRSKKYQGMFKDGEKKKIIWQHIANEMATLGFEFGTRDPKMVCAQKWRNLQMKSKRLSDMIIA